MTQEIGGYMEFEISNGIEYHNNAICLNSGRNCLEYLIELRNITSIWIPDYICSAIIDTCKKNILNIHSYPINENLKPVFPSSVNNYDYLYLTNYFGQLDYKDYEYAQKIFGCRIIIDNAQDFFAKPFPQADTLYTCRKYFGVPDGAYLYTKDGAQLNRVLPTDYSHNRLSHIVGRFEESANIHFDSYHRNEQLLDNLRLSYMSKLTHNLLKGIDYEYIITKRNTNWDFYETYLNKINDLVLKKPNGAFAYPLYIPNGSTIKKKLVSEKIYIPTLWPNVLHDCDKETWAFLFSDNLLALPLDQRYTNNDLQKIIHIIMQNMK